MASHDLPKVGLPYAYALERDNKFGVECPKCGAFIPEDHDPQGETITSNYSEHYLDENLRELKEGLALIEQAKRIGRV